MYQSSSVSMQTSANPKVQRKINTSIIFNYLRRHGPSYRARIARELKMSAPAVSRAVEKLKDEGYVVESGNILTSTGKRAALVELNLAYGCVIAVDLMKEHMKIAAFDMSGNIIKRAAGRRYAESKNVIEDLYADIDQFIEQSCGNGERLPQPIALSIGVPAAVDSDQGSILGGYLYPSLKDLNLKKEFEDKYEIDVFVGNDVNLGAIAENRLGREDNHRCFVYIDVSDGIGSGVVNNGNLLRGGNGFAGEIGYMLPSVDDFHAKGSTKGYLEDHASIESIRKQAIAAILAGKPTGMTDLVNGVPESITPNMVFEAAYQGDAVAGEIVSKAVKLLAHTAFTVTLVVDPKEIVFGGDIYEMPHIYQLVIEPISRYLEKHIPYTVPEVVLSSLGSDACLMGASLAGLDLILGDLYPFRLAECD